MKRLLGILSFWVFWVGCNYSIQKHPEAVPPNSNYKASELTFNSIYSRVLRTNCVSCHGNSGSVNRESYAAVKANLSKVYQAAIVERKMPKPPTSPLTADQLGLLNAWIKSGAPESADGSEPDLPPLEPKYASIRAHILEKTCLACHAPGKPAARVPFITKEDLLNSPLDLVIPGNPDESGIILAVTNQDPNKSMPPSKDASGQPTGFSPLTEDEIKIISEWIKNGANE